MNIRPQYHFRQSEKGLLAWDVRILVALASELTPRDVSLNRIEEYREPYWHNEQTPLTCEKIAEHTKLIQEANLSYPIILCNEGRLMDGMHRVCKAHLIGKDTISAVQFTDYIPPHHIGKQPDELSY